MATTLQRHSLRRHRGRKMREARERSRRWHRSAIQALRFPKQHFTRHMAKSWAKRNRFKYGRVEEMANYWSLRQFDPEGRECRYMTLPDTDPPVEAVICEAASNPMATSKVFGLRAQLGEAMADLEHIAQLARPPYAGGAREMRAVHRQIETRAKSIRETLSRVRHKIEDEIHSDNPMPGRVVDGKRMEFGETIPGVPSTGELMGTVDEIRYVHFEDGKAYKHAFKHPPSLYALPDGSLHIWHPVHRLWSDY